MNEALGGPVTLFAGGLRPLPPEGQMTGMFKTRQAAPVRVSREGLAGDAQGDRRYHGGPDKAVHLYPADHYARLVAAFPALAGEIGPGTLGENLSVAGVDEAMVCLGDVFALGECRLQITQPRRPCWKIDHRLGVGGASRHVADAGITGWYFRVLAEGLIAPETRMQLIERPNPEVSIARLWAVETAHRPAVDEVRRLSRAEGLSAGWAKKLGQRADWLERHGDERRSE
ncbi:MOSC domain-containing protein [Denitromonas iodatirespirans]|uniref:MOSC domain-containing protein n=1 Tax=Denitromonas iodatirespirans TaxID=2795389 RepID=A0A944H696_DENI1|nr:MOSC domain-containing protein [Denitromonas iodatirespirans]MBT0959949.1 MOSC domain-containing protein [Denitromonas iodatirespirans]